MRVFAAIDALPSLESMKFPVFSLLTGNFGLFRDEFAADCFLQRRVMQTRSSLALDILDPYFLCLHPRSKCVGRIYPRPNRDPDATTPTSQPSGRA